MEDLNATPVCNRTWGTRAYACTWAGMVLNPASLAVGAALLALGLNAIEATIAHFSAGLILVLALTLTAWPGCKFGIPFPVLARSAFGSHGAQFCTLSRALVAILWLSFQMWQGASGLVFAISSAHGAHVLRSVQLSKQLDLLQLLLLLIFAAGHALAIWLGVKRFRPLVYFVAPFQLAGCIGLAIWAASLCSIDAAFRAGSDNALMHTGGVADRHADGHTLGGPLAWLTAINASVSTWSTLVLNVADLSRFATSQRQLALGQSAGLPLPFALTGLLGMWIAGATRHAYGEAMWQVPQYFSVWHPALALVGGVVLALSILVVNVIANLLSPMNDFLNIAPERFDFKVCGYLCIVLAIAVCPWHLFAERDAFILTFLNGYAIVTGAIAGVIVGDFWLVRRAHLDLDSLYAPPMCYAFNWRAFIAVSVGVLPGVVGFLHSLGAVALPSGVLGQTLQLAYGASWFTALVFALCTFLALEWCASAKNRGKSELQPSSFNSCQCIECQSSGLIDHVNG